MVFTYIHLISAYCICRPVHSIFLSFSFSFFSFLFSFPFLFAFHARRDATRPNRFLILSSPRREAYTFTGQIVLVHKLSSPFAPRERCATTLLQACHDGQSQHGPLVADLVASTD